MFERAARETRSVAARMNPRPGRRRRMGTPPQVSQRRSATDPAQPADTTTIDATTDTYTPPATADIEGLHRLDLRGYLLLLEPKTDRAWYAVDGAPYDRDNPRPCPHCARMFVSCGDCDDKMSHDPCIGHIAGVAYACCGHGEIESAYISWPDRSTVRNTKALRVMARLGRGPELRRFRWPRRPTRGTAAMPSSVVAAQLAAASNPNTDPDLLEALSRQWQPQVRAAAAPNPSLPLHALSDLSQDPESEVAELAEAALAARSGTRGQIVPTNGPPEPQTAKAET